jgi:hypothetical protein
MLGTLLDFLMVLSAGGPSTLVGRVRSVDAGEAETLGGVEVTRILLGAFIVAHGLLTAFIWVSSPNADAPFRAGRSWLVGEARSLAVVAALVAAAGFVLAGVGFIADQAWWAVIGVGAGAVALVLMTLFFNPWLLAGIAISAGVLYAGVQALPQA